MQIMYEKMFSSVQTSYSRAFRSIWRWMSRDAIQRGDFNPPRDNEMCLIEPCMLDPERPQPKIVIVGAGVAGLSAAQRLAHCGLSDITVLEATDRPGGRVHSCWLGDSVIELGAQWVLGGCPNNSVYSLAAREGLLPPPSPSPPPTTALAHPLFLNSDGRAVDPPLARAALHTFSLIESQARSLFNERPSKLHGALLTFINRRIEHEVLRYPEEQRYDVAAVLRGMANALRCWSGDDLMAVSADQFGSAIRVPGGNCRIPQGFVGVLAPLLRDLPECSVRYCKVVEKIQWGTSSESPRARALLRTSDGEEFGADYVIVTVSLGVLKATAEELFSPSLPADKAEAVQKLGFGAVCKVFLEYERPFWTEGCGALRLARAPDELPCCEDWLTGISHFEEVSGSRAVLCAWLAGPQARLGYQQASLGYAMRTIE